MEIFSPGDDSEMRACYNALMGSSGPAYLRVGKSDRNHINRNNANNAIGYFTRKNEGCDVVQLFCTPS